MATGGARDGMSGGTDVEQSAAVLQAQRLGLEIPAVALQGVVANQLLLARHHAVVRDALAEDAR